MRRGTVLLTAGMAVSLLLSAPANAATTSAFDASFKETFGRAHSKPCEHFLCGTGTVAGYGAATSVFDITDFAPIEDTNCADLSAVRTITLVSDGSTLELDEVGTVCFPGNSSLAPGAQKSFGNPGTIRTTFTVSGGTGVFEDAIGSGTDTDMPAGDAGHASLSGTLTLP
jgi:hypothetical protein